MFTEDHGIVTSGNSEQTCNGWPTGPRSIPTAWYFRATIRKDQGDLAGAKSDLQEALRLMPPEDGHRRSVSSLLVQVKAELGE